MKNLEWVPVLYNGIETNVEVTKCGRVRRVKKEWYGKGLHKIKLGEVDFSKLRLSHGYKSVGIQIKGCKKKTIQVQQLVASAFLGYKWQGHKLVVDHIDSNNLNNHVNNLQVITNRENNSKERTVKSGLPVGVSWCKKTNKYVSQIYINKKKMHLGYFNTIIEASQTYQNNLKQLFRIT